MDAQSGGRRTVSLPRQDLKVKVDAEVHEAFSAIAEYEGLQLNQLLERLIMSFCLREQHRQKVLGPKIARLRISGNLGDYQGILPLALPADESTTR